LNVNIYCWGFAIRRPVWKRRTRPQIARGGIRSGFEFSFFVRPEAVSSFSNRGLECKRFVIFPLDSILLFDRAAGILPPRPQTCLATARSGGQ
jgi:hypothetical protein